MNEIYRCEKCGFETNATAGGRKYFENHHDKECGKLQTEQAEALSLSDLLWRDISTAPKDGAEIVGWFMPNEVEAPEKAKPWITRWEMKQFKDGTGKKIGKPFGMWVTEGWRDPMSYAPTKWTHKP